MADPRIWNRFPLDLLPLVIEHTAAVDLFDWYLLTEHVTPAFLHRVVLREMYRVVHINKDLLLRYSGKHQDLNDHAGLEDNESGHRSESDWVDESDSGPEPGNLTCLMNAQSLSINGASDIW